MAKYKFTSPELRLRAPQPGVSGSLVDTIIVSPAQNPPASDYDLEHTAILLQRRTGDPAHDRGWLATVTLQPILADQLVENMIPGDYRAFYVDSQRPPFAQRSPASNIVTVKTHEPIPN